LRKLLQALRALSPVDEFIIVAVAAFGPFVAVNIQLIILSVPADHHVRDEELLFLLLYEVVLLLLLGGFLHVRGWTLERIGLGPNLKQTILGIALYGVVLLLSQAALLIASFLVPGFEKHEAEFDAAKGALNPVLVALLSVVNPIFEEGFLCGFMITALKGRTHPLVAAAASVTIRTIYHAYQGPLGIISVLPFGIVLTLCYLRWGRLWPLIVAHICGDFLPLMLYSLK
jgi:uncharacterized protein